MPDPGRKITIRLVEGDPDSDVQLSLVEEATTVEGSGLYFQRRNPKFNNGEDTSRVYAVRKVTHRKRKPEDAADDEDQTINVEVIFEMTTAEGSGQYFNRRIYTLNWDEITAKRRTHIKRVFRRNDDGSKDEDIWIDVRRKDQFVTLEGSGQYFRRRQQTMLWDDEDDDNPFDKNILPTDPAPIDFKKAYRLDFFQDVVNINAGIPLLVIAVTNRATGELPGVILSFRDMAFFTFNSPLVPAVPAPPPPSTAPAKPQIPARVQILASFATAFGLTYPNGVDAPPSISDPFTADMKKKLLYWDTGGFVGTTSVGVTIFINLNKYKQGGKKTALFSVEIPANVSIGDLARRHVFGADFTGFNHGFGTPISYSELDFIDPGPDSDFKSLAAQKLVAQQRANDARDVALAALHAADPASTLDVGEVYDLGKINPDDPDPIQDTRNTKIQTYTFRGGKTFPLKDGLPDLTKTEWKTVAGDPRWIDTQTKTVDAPGPFPATSVKIALDLTTLKVTLTV